jgi:hypothetical protein
VLGLSGAEQRDCHSQRPRSCCKSETQRETENTYSDGLTYYGDAYLFDLEGRSSRVGIVYRKLNVGDIVCAKSFEAAAAVVRQLNNKDFEVVGAVVFPRKVYVRSTPRPTEEVMENALDLSSSPGLTLSTFCQEYQPTSFGLRYGFLPGEHAGVNFSKQLEHVQDDAGDSAKSYNCLHDECWLLEPKRAELSGT